MRQRGFTLIELLIVIAIMGVLLTLASLNYGSMQSKAEIEREVATIYSSLMEVRLQALHTKTARAVAVSGKQFSIYSSQETSVAPRSVSTLAYPMVMNSGADRVVFDARGMMVGVADAAICVDPSGTLAENAGNTDAVHVSATKIYMGKRPSGGACVPADIDQK